MTTKDIKLANEEALIHLACEMAPNLSAGQVIYLEGELGVGKTTFARALLHALGYEGFVKSPTYSLVEPYRISDKLFCYHFDLYRLSDPEELEFTGSRDYFNEDSICLIEWPEKALGFLPPADIRICLQYDGDGRKLTIYNI